jgi:steroid 5-alpha reductase family enzyme
MDVALRNGVLGCAAVIALSWLLSLITREYSWVDRLWSIVPPAYVAYFAWVGGWDGRLLLMTACATAWGVRLTFNFARKGGYAPGGEDYRWVALRKRMSPGLFQVFNLFFTAGFQNALIFAITLPAYAAALRAGVPLGPLDALATALFAGFLVLETVADQQQWRFQEAKKVRRARGEAVTEEFLQTGLFRYSRHPNFFAEQLIWWSFTLFAVASGAGWANWTSAGALVLTLLFQGSTNFTEELTLAKYPSYAEYQKKTSRLIPMPPRPGR